MPTNRHQFWVHKMLPYMGPGTCPQRLGHDARHIPSRAHTCVGGKRLCFFFKVSQWVMGPSVEGMMPVSTGHDARHISPHVQGGKNFAFFSKFYSGSWGHQWRA